MEQLTLLQTLALMGQTFSGFALPIIGSFGVAIGKRNYDINKESRNLLAKTNQLANRQDVKKIKRQYINQFSKIEQMVLLNLKGWDYLLEGLEEKDRVNAFEDHMKQITIGKGSPQEGAYQGCLESVEEVMGLDVLEQIRNNFSFYHVSYKEFKTVNDPTSEARNRIDKIFAPFLSSFD